MKNILVNGNHKSICGVKEKAMETRKHAVNTAKGKSIRKRDRSVYSRQEAGHWEADTVVSGQGKE